MSEYEKPDITLPLDVWREIWPIPSEKFTLSLFSLAKKLGSQVAVLAGFSAISPLVPSILWV